jgi:hypothetical protein
VFAVVVMAVAGLFLFRGSLPWSGGGTTTIPADPGYTAQVAHEFEIGCVREAYNTTDFCTCLYNAIRTQISYAKYEQINQQIDQGRRIEDTEVWPLAQDCWQQHPPVTTRGG